MKIEKTTAINKYIGINPIPKKWYEKFIPFFGKLLYKKRVRKIIPPFTNFKFPIIKNIWPTISCREMFSGPSLLTSIERKIKFEFINLNWFQRKVQQIKFWWDKKHGKILID